LAKGSTSEFGKSIVQLSVVKTNQAVPRVDRTVC
jgi:hypothetical protein